MDGSTGKTDQVSMDYTRIYSVFYPFRIRAALSYSGTFASGREVVAMVFLASGAGIYYVCRSFGIYNVFGRYTPLCEDSIILSCHVYRGVYKY